MEIGIISPAQIESQKDLVPPALFHSLQRGETTALGLRDVDSQIVGLLIYQLQIPFCEILHLYVRGSHRQKGYATLLLSHLTCHFQSIPTIHHISMSLPLSQLYTDGQRFALHRGFTIQRGDGCLVHTTLGDFAKERFFRGSTANTTLMAEALPIQRNQLVQVIQQYIDIDSSLGLQQDYLMGSSVFSADKRGIRGFSLLSNHSDGLELSLLYCRPDAPKSLFQILKRTIEVALTTFPPETPLHIAARTEVSVNLCHKLFAHTADQTILRFTLPI